MLLLNARSDWYGEDHLLDLTKKQGAHTADPDDTHREREKERERELDRTMRRRTM